MESDLNRYVDLKYLKKLKLSGKKIIFLLIIKS